MFLKQAIKDIQLLKVLCQLHSQKTFYNPYLALFGDNLHSLQ